MITAPVVIDLSTGCGFRFKNHKQMAEISKKTLSSLSAHVHKQGYHTANHETTVIDGQEIEFSYGKFSGIKIHSTNPVTDPQKTPPTQKATTAKPSPAFTKLQTLLKSGEITRKNNWYKYKGVNYLGRAKIIKAIQ